MKNIIRLVSLLFLVPAFLFSQPGISAVPFLQIGPSAGLGAYMAANSVLPTDDTFGFYYNPAQLGVFSRNNNFSAQFYPVKMKWLPAFNFSDLYFTSKALNAGYVFKDMFEEMDVNVGVGYIRTFLNLGENVLTDDNGNVVGTFDSHESYDAFSIGFGFEYFARFSFGYTYKTIISDLIPSNIVVGNEIISGKAEAISHDFGMMVGLPILKDHLRNFDNAVFIDDNISLFSNAYWGYAVTNSGDFVRYGKNDQADPLPKKAQIGLGFSVGLMQELEFASFKLIEIEVAREAQDILIEFSSYAGKSYQSGFGDINVIDHILSGKADELVQVNTSLRINLAETIFIGIHKMKGPGFPEYIHNTAFTFSTRVIFKFLAGSEESAFLKDILSHVDLRYSQSNINASKDSPLRGTKYQGISLTLYGLFN